MPAWRGGLLVDDRIEHVQHLVARFRRSFFAWFRPFIDNYVFVAGRREPAAAVTA
ncbi:MAG: hypothetical protein ACK2UV_03190 [Candidatus Promineifilaceae bacterium]